MTWYTHHNIDVGVIRLRSRDDERAPTMTVKQAQGIKAVCDRDALVDALSLITGVVAARTPTPALQCVRLSGQDGRLTLAATDMEASLTLTIDRVDIETSGEILIPADKISQIARSCNDSTLTIVGNGKQSRDFVYVKDVVEVLTFMMETTPQIGIYNLGSGIARTFYDLVLATFSAMNIECNISFIDTPEDIRDKYQYFTQADMLKLQSVGYNKPFTTLEDGVEDYVQNYLLEKNYY